MSTTAPLDVPVAVTPGTALWVQHLDRARAEAALSAAAAADPTVVRWLAHPKGADTVLSLLIPSTPKFFHEKIVANPDGIFACAGAQGKAVRGLDACAVQPSRRGAADQVQPPVPSRYYAASTVATPRSPTLTRQPPFFPLFF